MQNKIRGRLNIALLVYNVYKLVYLFFKSTFPVLRDENTLYGIPIFHAYAHNINCQLHFNPRYVTGFGLTDGEVYMLNIKSYVILKAQITFPFREQKDFGVLQMGLCQ